MTDLPTEFTLGPGHFLTVEEGEEGHKRISTGTYYGTKTTTAQEHVYGDDWEIVVQLKMSPRGRKIKALTRFLNISTCMDNDSRDAHTAIIAFLKSTMKTVGMELNELAKIVDSLNEVYEDLPWSLYRMETTQVLTAVNLILIGDEEMLKVYGA